MHKTMTIIALFCLVPALITTAQTNPVSRAEFKSLENRLHSLEKQLAAERNPLPGAQGPLLLAKDISASLGATFVLQGSSGTTSDVTDASASYELEFLASPIPAASIYAHIEAGNGAGIDEDISSFSGFNGDADDSSVAFTEFWYAQSWFDGRLVVEAGKICLGGPGDNGPEEAIAFDANQYANDERSQFLSPAFINNLALDLPDNGPAFLFRISPAELLDLNFGIADADADMNNVFDNLFAIAQADLNPHPHGRAGTYRIYAWFNGADHEKFSDPESKTDNYGFGLSLDQPLSPSLGIFLRYGRQRAGVAAVEHAISTGFELAGNPWNRPDDAFGLAGGILLMSDDWEDAQRAAGLDPAREQHIETYYKLRINDNLSISPDLQWIHNPDGDAAADDVWSFGLRAQMTI